MTCLFATVYLTQISRPQSKFSERQKNSVELTLTERHTARLTDRAISVTSSAADCQQNRAQHRRTCQTLSVTSSSSSSCHHAVAEAAVQSSASTQMTTTLVACHDDERSKCGWSQQPTLDSGLLDRVTEVQ